MRGSAQNPDVFFQAREACNPFYVALPAIVQQAMDRFAELTGRAYRLFDYAGDPEAERVVVLMGSGTGAAQEAVEQLPGTGVLTVRLFRPFDAEAFCAALPASVRSVAVLDRTKEPGALGEPLYQDVVTALAEQGRADARASAAATGSPRRSSRPRWPRPCSPSSTPRRRATTSRSGSSTTSPTLSLEVDRSFQTEADDVVRAVFYGLGSDGTVGANKNSVKIVGEQTPLYAQGYFVYDSKKSGSVTVSHLRFSPRPIGSTYLIERRRASSPATSSGCSSAWTCWAWPRRARPSCSTARTAPTRSGSKLPHEVRARSSTRASASTSSTQARSPARPGSGSASTPSCRPASSRSRTCCRPTRRSRRSRTRSRRATARAARSCSSGTTRPSTARSRACTRCASRSRSATATTGCRPCPPARPTSSQRVTAMMIAGQGDLLPVSAPARRRHVPDRHGAVREALDRGGDPDLGSRDLHRLREVRARLPARGDPDEGLRPGRARRRPGGLQVEGLALPRPAGDADDDPGRPRRLHRLRDLRRDLPGQVEGGGAPQVDRPRAEAASTSTRSAPTSTSSSSIPEIDRTPVEVATVKGSQMLRAAVRVLGRLRGLRRDAVPEAADPALRRPDARRQRDRLLVDLRRQPADDAVVGERRRPRPGLGELALRGQRRVRARDAARARRPAPSRRAALVGEVVPDLAPALLDGADARDEAGIAAQRDARRRARRAARRDRHARGAAARAARRRARPQERLDRRRRRLGLRHRLRRARPRARLRPRRQRARARHRGLLEHRRPGLEVDAARRGREVRRRRQGDRARRTSA